MITHRSLLNRKPNILYCSICLFGLILFISCKSRKNANTNKEEVRPHSSKTLDAATEMRFGAMFVDGCSARLKGNLEEAKKLFIECNKIDPSNNAVKYELAVINKMAGVNDQALFYAKACAQAEPKNEWYQLILIECYNVLRLYDQSIKVRENLVKNFPYKNEFKEDLAIQYAVMGYYEKSFKIYDELEKVFGINEQIITQKSNLLKSLKKYKEAEAELKRLSDSNKDEPRYYSYLADFYIEQNNLGKAKEMYDKILILDPNNPGVNLALHDYYSAQGNTSEAFECLKKAFLNPDLDINTKATIMNTFFSRRDEGPYFRDNGPTLAKIFVQVHPQSPEANSVYGDYLSIEKRILEASEYYYKAAIKEKGNFVAWDKLLYTYNRLSMFDSLEHNSALAMEYFPNSPRMYLYNGQANYNLRNFKKAAQSLRDGIEFVVDDKLLMLEFYFSLGDAYYYGNEFENSYKAFENALKLDSDNTQVLNQYAYYLSLRKDNLDKAEKLSKKANELQPGNRAFMDTYGWILFQQKKYKESEVWLSDAVKLGPKNATILEHYGDVLFKLDRPAEAIKYWESSKAAGSNSEALIKKLKDKKLDE